MKRPVFRFTLHAVERFCERVCPEVPQAHAVARLHDISVSAELMFARSARGDPVYSIPSPPMIWVAKHEGDEAVIVTIVPDPKDIEPAMVDADKVSQRISRAVAAAPRLSSSLRPTPSPAPPADGTASKKDWAKVTGLWIRAEMDRLALAREALKNEGEVMRTRIDPPRMKRAKTVRYEESAAAGWHDGGCVPLIEGWS